MKSSRSEIVVFGPLETNLSIQTTLSRGEVKLLQIQDRANFCSFFQCSIFTICVFRERKNYTVAQLSHGSTTGSLLKVNDYD